MSEHDSQLLDAREALSKKDYEKVLSILSPLVEIESPGAISLLGLMYQLGEGVELNGIKAVELYLRAIELGDGVAAHNLGTIYITGLPDVDKNINESKRYYRLAKEMGAKFAPDEFYE